MRVLYSYAPSFNLFIGAFFPFGIALLWNLVLPLTQKEDQPKNTSLQNIGLMLLVLMLALSIFLFAGYWKDHRANVECLEAGTYKTVEGTVTEFHPMPEVGHDSEHFLVDGVYFDYSGNDLSIMGYRTPQIRGGVIRGDGQELVIRYRTDSHGNNLILFIGEKEELP